MHKVNHMVLYSFGNATRLGIILDVLPGTVRPYLVSDRFSKVRFWVSEEEILDSIAPAQPSTSSATTAEL